MALDLIDDTASEDSSFNLLRLALLNNVGHLHAQAANLDTAQAYMSELSFWHLRSTDSCGGFLLSASVQQEQQDDHLLFFFNAQLNNLWAPASAA